MTKLHYMMFISFQRFIVFLITSLIVGIVYFVFFYEETDYKLYSCQYYYKLKELKFNGIVEKKYIDKYDRSAKKIIVNREAIIFRHALRESFELIKIEDSVYLDKENDLLSIYRGNKILHEISIKKLCPEYPE